MGSSSQAAQHGSANRGDAFRLGGDWGSVEVPAKVLADMLCCRQTHLQQNYGTALVPVRRGMYRLESVGRAIDALRERHEEKEDSRAADQERVRLRNLKLRAEIHKTQCTTANFVARLKAQARDELLDELTDLAVMLRDEIRGKPEESVVAHNRFVEAIAARFDAASDDGRTKVHQRSEEDNEGLESRRWPPQRRRRRDEEHGSIPTCQAELNLE